MIIFFLKNIIQCEMKYIIILKGNTVKESEGVGILHQRNKKHIYPGC